MDAAAAAVPPPPGLPAAAGGDGGRAAMLEAGAGGSLDAGQVGPPDRRSKVDPGGNPPSTVPTAAGSLGGPATGVRGAAAAHPVVVAPPLHYQGVTLAAAAAKGDLPQWRCYGAWRSPGASIPCCRTRM